MASRKPAGFLGEVHAGDTLDPELKIIGLEPGTGTAAATVHSQRRELVLSGEHRYLLRRTPTS